MMRLRCSARLCALALAGCSPRAADVGATAGRATPRDGTTTSPSVARPEVVAAVAEPVPKEVVAPVPPSRSPALELTFVGDVIFGRYRASGFDPIPEGDFPVFRDIAGVLASDVLVGNLETPLVRDLPQQSPIGSRYRFGASPEHAKHLRDAGFSVVSLANNHWYDQRLLGVEQSPEILRELGVVPIGAAVREPPVFRVEAFEKSGWKIGFIAITTRTNAPVREGGPILPYLRTDEIKATISPVIAEAREKHDLVAVVVHWGEEYAEAPNHAQVSAAHAMIDAGADLVIGHHPHVLQAIERYGNGLIAYSLGNFLFENTNDIPRLTGVLRVRARAQGRCLERVVFHPAYIKRLPVQHPVPATGGLGKRVRQRVIDQAARFDTSFVPEGEELVLAAQGCP